MVQYHGPRPDLGLDFVHSYLALPEWRTLTHASEGAFIPGHRGDEHVHSAHEITYLLSGRGERIVDGHAHALQPRDYHLTWPGELHFWRADRKTPCRYVTLGVDLGSLPAARTREVAMAFERLRPLHNRVVRGSVDAEKPFRRLLAELDRAETEPALRPLCVLVAQALTTEIVVRFARCVLEGGFTAADESEPAPLRPGIQALLSWLRGRLADPPTVHEMARRVGLSRGHFIAAFRREVGRTPIEYLTAARIAEAARKLRAGDGSVGEVSAALGFSTARYFSQVFRRVKGCTPSDWQRRHAS
jgi:AraC-like DNA-binding protein